MAGRQVTQYRLRGLCDKLPVVWLAQRVSRLLPTRWYTPQLV
nr:MAG TPA: hypothetical protein [Caudoviricetes sp.]